jgi:uncharacterized protein (TIGR02271 family)
MQDQPGKGAGQPRADADNPTDEAGGVSRSTGPEDTVVIPVVAEELSVETARVARSAVRVHKRVETTEQTIATPLVHEEVVVERVPIERQLIEGPPPEPREEQGVLIIPVFEEIAVVEKRLMLCEEIRVSRRSITTTTSQVVPLRREVVDVERVEQERVVPERFQGLLRQAACQERRLVRQPHASLPLRSRSRHQGTVPKQPVAGRRERCTADLGREEPGHVGSEQAGGQVRLGGRAQHSLTRADPNRPFGKPTAERSFRHGRQSNQQAAE